MTKYIKKSFEYSTESSSFTGDKIYKGAVLLVPGTYRDSASRLKIYYDPKVLKKNVQNWTKNYLNINHDDSVLSRIGTIENPRWENDAIVADLRIIPVTTAAKDVINLIDSGLVNNLSIEALTEEYYDEKIGCLRLSDITFTGAAIVTNPACPDAIIRVS